MGMDKAAITLAGTTFCAGCGWGVIEVDDEYLDNAGRRHVTECPSCSGEFDYWARLVASVSDRSDLWHAVTLAGGFTTTFVESVPQGKLLSLELHEYGIPDDAVIFKVLHTVLNFGPNQGLPVLTQVTQKVGGPLPGNFTFQPIVLGSTDDRIETDFDELKVAFKIVWAPNQMDSPAQGLLLSSFGAYGEGDMKRSLLDADSAVDISLKQLVTANLVGGWNRKLPNLGFEQRLLVLTAAASAPGVRPLPMFLLESLLDLRAERNRVAHGSNAAVDTVKAAHLICAALVAMFHLKRMHV